MSTDERFDETITSWLEQTAPARLPDRVLEATFERTRTGRQQSGWRAALGRMPLARPALALGSVAAVLVAATLALNVAVAPSVGQRPALPATPGAWQRVVLDAGVEGRVGALATGPRGLLAAVGDGDGSRLYFSADGRDWTLVPADQHGPIGQNGGALVATDHGFLLVGAEVLASEDGLSWQRIADPTTEPDLGAGTPSAAAAAGPGVVAVGSDNKAWYSTDGIEWTLAAVPPPPDEPSQLERPLDRTKTQGAVEMQGVAVSGTNLIAWGISIWVHDDDSATFVPVLWASTDGVSWTRVDAPQWTYPKVAGGPDGFAVASNDGAVWLSADGRSWERVAEDAFGPSRWPDLRDDEGFKVEMHLRSIVAGVAGYIAAGADGVCLLRCASAETVIWTSPDGRSWARLPEDDRFMAPNGAGAGVAVAWGSDFIVGGESDDRPTIWISGPEPTAATPSPTPPQSPITLLPLTERFDSALNGISMGYPAGWQTRQAAEPWTDGVLGFDAAGVDIIFDPTSGEDLYFALASEPLRGRLDHVWRESLTLPECPGGHGGGVRTVDGATGWVVACGGARAGSRVDSALLVTDTRAYAIVLYAGSERLAETYSFDWFWSVVQTLDLS